MKSLCATSRRRRAFTLAEALVVSVLVVTLLGAVYGLFLPVLGLASASGAKANSQAPVTSAIAQLEADLRVTDATGVSTNAGVPQVTLGPAAEVTAVALESSEKFANANDYHGQYYYDPSTGLPLWESYVIWALVSNADGTSTLYRTTIPNPNPPSVASTPLSPTDLSNATANISTTGRVMARETTSFQLAVNQNIGVGSCTFCNTPRAEILVQLADQDQDQTGHVSVTTYQTQSFARN